MVIGRFGFVRGPLSHVKCGCSSVVEHLLAKEDVASSSLVTRSLPADPLGGSYTGPSSSADDLGRQSRFPGHRSALQQKAAHRSVSLRHDSAYPSMLEVSDVRFFESKFVCSRISLAK